MKERLLFLFIDVLRDLLTAHLNRLRVSGSDKRLERFSAYAEGRMRKRGSSEPSLTDTDIS